MTFTPHRSAAAVAALVACGLTISACSSSNDKVPTPAQVKDAVKVNAASGGGKVAAGVAIGGVVAPSAPTAPATTPPATTTTTASADGKAVFTANCASCHTLKAAGASGAVGPNLDQLKPADARVATQVTNGGGAMPAFAGQLSPAEIKAVAAYVASSAGA